MIKAKTTIKLIALCLLLVSVMNIFSCVNSTEKGRPSAEITRVDNFGYNLSYPDKTFILPDILHEISGISVIDSSSVACVQDENGIVFIYDILKQVIKKKIPFHDNGDYEGLTRVNKTLFVLRSDGMLFEIPDYGSSNSASKVFLKGLPGYDYEGLCYDKKNNRLLIAPKGKSGKGSEFKKNHPIFGLDLNSGKLIKVPVFKIDLSELKRFASDNKVINTNKSKKKSLPGESDISFRPSAIGIHPLTGELFVLAGIEHMLFVFDIKGTIKYMEKLDQDIFNQPEGITFFKNGDMLISNEGQSKKPTLIRFNYQ